MFKEQKYNIQNIKKRIENYCSIKDRCVWEVKQKLSSLGVLEKESKELIKELTENRFIDNQRYAESYCRGKFRIKKWGRIKIRKELERKKIPIDLIKKGMEKINEIEYFDVLKELYVKKKNSTNEQDKFIRKGKISRYLQQKGFEMNIIWKIINTDK